MSAQLSPNPTRPTPRRRPTLRSVPRPVGRLARTPFLMVLAGILAIGMVGLLLLNTTLTVEEGQAASHAGKGWEVLTDAVIRHVAEGPRPVVFMLWGSHAQAKRALIPEDRGHLVLLANHPSPLSARSGFFGSRPFSKVNALLERQGAEPIDWDLNQG